MNRVILTGRIVKDPTIRYTGGDSSMCIANFVLAVNRRGRKEEGKQTADFPSCTAFGKTAEFIEKYAKKGMKFDVVGRLQTGNYKNKDGQTVYTTDVVIDEIEFGESKGEKKDTEPADFVNIPDEIEKELPFN